MDLALASISAAIWVAFEDALSIPALKKAGVERQARVDASIHCGTSTPRLSSMPGRRSALSSYLGHSDPGFTLKVYTLKVYTHLLPSSKQRTRKVVDAVFCGDGSPSPQAVLTD
jgi:hypothetical protein